MPALQTHFRRAALARLERAAHDLGDIEQVRPLRTLVLARTLRERAEGAAIAADVGVIDVAVDDIRGDGAVRLRAQRVRRFADSPEIGAARIEKCRERLPVHVLRAVLHELIEKLRHRRRTRAPLRRREARGQIDTAAGAPAILARERCTVALLEHGAAHGRVEPLGRRLGVRRIDRQPLHESLAAALGLAAQPLDLGPWHFRIDIIRRQRRDPAPIVDACCDQFGKRRGTQVGRRLNAHVGSEHEPGGGDGPEQLLAIGGGRMGHDRAGLGHEILNDDFLNVAVTPVQCVDGTQRLDALFPSLADADEQSRGERNLLPPGFGQSLEAHRGQLVR